MKKLENITIGTDAEVFLMYEDCVISAIGVIGGSKDEPKDIDNNCFIQEDNILAEFNIPPVTTKEEFISYISYCKDWIEINFPELKLHFSSSEMVEDFVVSTPKAKEFGCEPDCIVDLTNKSDEMNKDKYDIMNQQRAQQNVRTSGFHIHIGYKNSNHKTNREIVKLFEKYVTIPLLDEDNDQHDRRKMYGKAGSYRHKPYGVECRSLGGYFIKNEETISKVWDLVQVVIEKYNQGERVSKHEFKQIKQIINNKQTICVD